MFNDICDIQIVSHLIKQHLNKKSTRERMKEKIIIQIQIKNDTKLVLC